MSALKSLKEFNNEQMELIRRVTQPHPNGLECPTCKGELWDSSPALLALSYPPQKGVHCPNCDYRGTRIA